MPTLTVQRAPHHIADVSSRTAAKNRFLTAVASQSIPQTEDRADIIPVSEALGVERT